MEEDLPYLDPLCSLDEAEEVLHTEYSRKSAKGLLHTMFQCTGISRVQNLGFHAICLFLTDPLDGPRLKENLLKANVINTVIIAMKTHPDKEKTQIWALRTMTFLVWCDENTASRFVREGVGELVNHALREHFGSADIQEWGCRSIAALTAKHRLNQVQIYRSGSLPLVTVALRKFSHCQKVMEASCAALYNLTHVEDALKEAQGTASASMHIGNRNVEKESEKKTGGKKPEKHNTISLGEQLVLSVVHSMKEFPRNSGLQEWSLRALSVLCYQRYDTQAAVATGGGLRAVIATIRLHALSAGSSVDRTTKPSLTQPMSSCSNGAVMASCACRLLYVSGFRNDANAKKMIELNALDFVVAVLREHRESANCTANALSALFILTSHSSGRGLFLVHEDASLSVLGAMEDHPKDISVQLHGSMVITNLSSNESLKHSLVETNHLIDILSKRMKENIENVKLQVWYIAALCALAHGSNSNKKIIVESDIILWFISAIFDFYTYDSNSKGKKTAKECATMYNLLFRFIYSIGYTKAFAPMKEKIGEKTFQLIRKLFSIPELQTDELLIESTCKCVAALCYGCPTNQILCSQVKLKVESENEKNEEDDEKQDEEEKNNSSTKKTISRLVLSAIRMHPYVEGIQEWGLTAISGLSVNRVNQDLIVKYEGISDILKALENHKQSEVISEQACVALRTLCFKNKKNRILVKKKGSIDAIDEVLRIHREVPDVQYWGKKALETIKKKNKPKKKEVVSK
eukprot:g32.t1